MLLSMFILNNLIDYRFLLENIMYDYVKEGDTDPEGDVEDDEKPFGHHQPHAAASHASSATIKRSLARHFPAKSLPRPSPVAFLDGRAIDEPPLPAID